MRPGAPIQHTAPRRLAKALPVIRQPFGAVQRAAIPLQTSPFLKEYILRSQPEYNVPRPIKIAKALPVIRQPFGAVQPGTIPLQTSPFLRSYPAEPPCTQRSARDKIAKALPVIRQPSAAVQSATIPLSNSPPS